MLGAAATLVALVVSAAPIGPAPATGADGSTGLWPSTYLSHQAAADCGTWKLDQNGFCVADDARNGLEVGTRFTASSAVSITGVRIYRYDPSTLRASLWDSSGNLLARGVFVPGPVSAWQDMTFASPVTIEPGRTYVVSYFTPKTRYAFGYYYFTDSGRTVGPITALRATAGEPNGVHCYDDAVCGSFPVRGYRDSTYWVTPLWAGAEQAAVPQPSPRAVQLQPQSRTVRASAKLRVTFSKSMQASSLNSSTVRLVSKTGRVALGLHYDAKKRLLTATPRHSLRHAWRYHLVITTHARDTQGNRLDQDAGKAGRQKASWTFRTR